MLKKSNTNHIKSDKNKKDIDDDLTTLNSDSHLISISNLSDNLTINSELKTILLEIIEKIKISKFGLDFSIPVLKVIPKNLKNYYLNIIKKPMDLNKLKNLIKNDKLITIGEFKENLFSIFKNSYKFNLEKSEIYERTIFTEKITKNLLSENYYNIDNNNNNVDYFIKLEIKNEDEKQLFYDILKKFKNLTENSFEFFHEYLSIHFPEIIDYKKKKEKEEVNYLLNNLNDKDRYKVFAILDKLEKK